MRPAELAIELVHHDARVVEQVVQREAGAPVGRALPAALAAQVGAGAAPCPGGRRRRTRAPATSRSPAGLRARAGGRARRTARPAARPALPLRGGRPAVRSRRPTRRRASRRRTPPAAVGHPVAGSSSRSSRRRSSRCPSANAESIMMARSSTPRSRAARSRISSGASSGQRCSGTLRIERTSREQTRPGRRGLVTSPSTAAKTGTCSGSAGRRQPSSRAAVTCVNTAVSGRTSSHASRSRANSSSSLSPSRTERNRPWLTRRKPTRRTSPRIGRSWLSCVCMSRRLRRRVPAETTCRATCGRDRGSPD